MRSPHTRYYAATQNGASHQRRNQERLRLTFNNSQKGVACQQQLGCVKGLVASTAGGVRWTGNATTVIAEPEAESLYISTPLPAI